MVSRGVSLRTWWFVERGVVTNADRLTQKAPIPVPFPKRLHFPMWLVEARVIRRKSPVPLDESLMAEKEAMLAGLRGVRETDPGLYFGDGAKRFERVLLAASIPGDVKTCMNGWK